MFNNKKYESSTGFYVTIVSVSTFGQSYAVVKKDTLSTTELRCFMFTSVKGGLDIVKSTTPASNLKN